MKIYPQKGVDTLRFGMTMEEVRNTWGQPQDIYHFRPLKHNLEDRDVIWEYGNGTELSFSSSDNFVLGTMTVAALDILLDGKLIIGKSVKEALLLFPDMELDSDFEDLGQDYTLPDRDLTFWVSDECVDSISLYPDYDVQGRMKVTNVGPETPGMNN